MHLWQASSAQRLVSLVGPGSPVNSVAVCPTSAVAAAGYSDGHICLFDTAAGSAGLRIAKIKGEIVAYPMHFSHARNHLLLNSTCGRSHLPCVSS